MTEQVQGHRRAARFVLVLLPAVLGACAEPDSRLALGTLERDRITLSATAAEIITSQPVAEGSTVQQGELLVQLDTRLQAAAVASAQADIAQWQATVEKLRNGPRDEEIAAAAARVDTAKSILLESDRDLERIAAIVNQGLGAQAELESAQTRRDSNAARVRDAEAQLQLLRAGTRDEDIREAEAHLQAARARLESEQQKLANLSVTATRPGTLDSLPWHVGERVSVGQPLAIVLADDAPYARVHIPEPGRAAIDAGDTLVVHVDGVEASFNGTVRWIALDPEFTPYYALNSAERSRLVWLAEVQLPDSASDLPAGLPVQVELPPFPAE